MRKTGILALLFLSILLFPACQPAAPLVSPTDGTLPLTPGSLPSASLTPAPDLSPSLTGRGGGVIAYTSMEGSDWQIYLVNADGSGQQRLTSGGRGGYEPNWSPEGARLVFQYGGLWLADLAAGAITRLPLSVEGDQLPNEYLVKPAWSPDEVWIAFLNEGGRQGDIYLIRPDGTDLRRLTDSNDISRDGNLVWSPDSRQLAYSAYSAQGIEIYVLEVEEALRGEAASLQLTDTPGTTLNLVTSWSSDGSRLAFSSDRDGNMEIYAMDPAGSQVVRLTENPASDTQPAWSPDGEQLAFTSDRDGDREIYILEVAAALEDPGGGNILRLTDHPGDDMGPVWRPTP